MADTSRPVPESQAAVKSQVLPDAPEATSHPAAAPKPDAIPPWPVDPQEVPALLR